MELVQLDLFSWQEQKVTEVAPQLSAAEWKIVCVRETASWRQSACSTPEEAVAYWRMHIATGLLFNPDVECFAVILLNTKYKIRGHHIVSVGALNEAMAHPREVFRAALIGAAYAVVCMHNHPSGDPTPSCADMNVTRALAETGRIVRVEVLDHIVVGAKTHYSMREAGVL